MKLAAPRPGSTAAALLIMLGALLFFSSSSSSSSASEAVLDARLQEAQSDAPTRPPTANPTLSLATMRWTESQKRIKALERAVADLSSRLKETSEALQQTRKDLSNVEATLFEDGSDPSNAVLDNLLFSPDARRWVKPCDWPRCRTMSFLNNAAVLIARQVNQTRPASTAGAKHRAVRLGASCDSALDSLLQQHVPGVARHVPGNASCVNTVTYSDLPDKTLDLLVFDGPSDQDRKPYLYQWLRDWAPKLRVGGLALGCGYKVDRPYLLSKTGAQSMISDHERAVKMAVDTFRLGDDNGLGQESTVMVAGGGMWYFVRSRSSLASLAAG